LNYAGKVPIDDTKKGGDFSCDSTCLNLLEVYASSPIVWQLQMSFTISVNKEEKGHKAADYKCAECCRRKELHL